MNTTIYIYITNIIFKSIVSKSTLLQKMMTWNCAKVSKCNAAGNEGFWGHLCFSFTIIMPLKILIALALITIYIWNNDMHMLWMRSLILLQINLAFGIERSCVFQGLIFLLKHIERAHPPRAAQTDRTDKHQRNFYSPSKFAALYGNHLSGVTKNAGHEWFYRSLTLYRGHSHQSWCDYKTLLKAVDDKNEWRLE